MTHESMARILFAYKFTNDDIDKATDLIPIPKKYVNRYKDRSREVYIKSLKESLRVEYEIQGGRP